MQTFSRCSPSSSTVFFFSSISLRLFERLVRTREEQDTEGNRGVAVTTSPQADESKHRRVPDCIDSEPGPVWGVLISQCAFDLFSIFFCALNWENISKFWILKKKHFRNTLNISQWGSYLKLKLSPAAMCLLPLKHTFKGCKQPDETRPVLHFRVMSPLVHRLKSTLNT